MYYTAHITYLHPCPPQMGLVEESEYPLDRLTSTLYVHHAAARDVGEYSCVATAGGAGSRPIHGDSPFKYLK